MDKPVPGSRPYFSAEPRESKCFNHLQKQESVALKCVNRIPAITCTLRGLPYWPVMKLRRNISGRSSLLLPRASWLRQAKPG